MSHLWTHGPLPDDYRDLYLCRNVYHCRPSELDQESAARVLRHMVCLDVEAEVMDARRRTKHRKTR